MRLEDKVQQLVVQLIGISENLLSLNLNDSVHDVQLLALQEEQEGIRYKLDEIRRCHPEYVYTEEQLELLREGVRLEQELIKRLTPIYIQASYHLKNQQLPILERKVRGRYFQQETDSASYFIDQRG